VEGCGTRLSRYNPLDVCDRHQRRGHHGQVRKQAKRTPTASCAAAEDFMEPARLPSKEELEMAGEERRQIGATKTRVLEYVALKGGWVGCGEIAERIGVATSTATSHLQGLFQAGRLERRAVEHGTGYHYRVHAEPESAKTTPASSQASAPLPQGEPPAADEAASSGPPGLSPEEPPAAGECACSTSAPLTIVYPRPSRELRVLEELEELHAVERERIIAYAVSRWGRP
jgi:DNA-binding MarR family transcriptional regulator